MTSTTTEPSALPLSPLTDMETYDRADMARRLVSSYALSGAYEADALMHAAFLKRVEELRVLDTATKVRLAGYADREVVSA